MYAICDGCLGVVSGNGIAISLECVCQFVICPVKPRLAVGHGSNKRLLIKKKHTHTHTLSPGPSG